MRKVFIFIIYTTLMNVFVMLIGCTPSEKRPSITLPSQWSNTSAFQTGNIELPQLAWWKKFQDPSLNQLIQTALRRNNDLKIAAANLELAQAQLKLVKLAWIPGMNIVAGYSQMPNLGDPGYFWGLFPLYALNILQQIKQQKSAEYQAKSQLYAEEAVRLTVIGQTAGSYFSLLAQQEALTLYQTLWKEQEELLRLYEIRFRFGLISRDAIDEAKRDLYAIQEQMVLVNHNIRVSQNALLFLLNKNPVQDSTAHVNPIFLKTPFSAINSHQIMIGNLPLTTLNYRPDVQQADASLRAAFTNIQTAQTNFLPSIRLDTLQGNSSLDNRLNLNEAYATIPILTPQTLGLVSISEAQYHALRANYIKTVRQALNEVENDLSAYALYGERLTNAQNALSEENNRCTLVATRYHQGIDNHVDITKCNIKRTQLALVVSQDKLEKMMTIVALYQALGSGYHANND